MKKSRFYFLLILALLAFCSGRAQADMLEILVSPIPPLVMTDKSASRGLLWDMAVLLAERLNKKHHLAVRSEPIVLPWARAYKEMTAGPGRMMLQMARSPDREELFEWISRTSNLSFAFVTRELPILNTLEEAREMKTIVVYRGSRLEKFLRSKGFDQTLVLANDSENSARLLNAGRVDAWYASTNEVMWLYKKGVLKVEPQIGRHITSIPVWAAASKGMPVTIQNLVRTELELMKTDGTFQMLNEKYGLIS